MAERDTKRLNNGCIILNLSFDDCDGFVSPCINLASLCGLFVFLCSCFVSHCSNLASLCGLFLSLIVVFLTLCGCIASLSSFASLCSNFVPICGCFLSLSLFESLCLFCFSKFCLLLVFGTFYGFFVFLCSLFVSL